MLEARELRDEINERNHRALRFWSQKIEQIRNSDMETFIIAREIEFSCNNRLI